MTWRVIGWVELSALSSWKGCGGFVARCVGQTVCVGERVIHILLLHYELFRFSGN